MVQQEAGLGGGILADEMGMGKTRTVLSLISQQFYPNCRPTLIVVPKSVIQQWMDEVALFSNLNGIVYRSDYGKNYYYSSFDVVVASYDALLVGTALRSIYWNRIVLDEAHRINNMKSRRFISVHKLVSKFRWSVSATIIQNQLNDLVAQIRFLRIRPYSDYNCQLHHNCTQSNPNFENGVCVTCGCRAQMHRYHIANLIRLAAGSNSLANLAKGEIEIFLTTIMLRRSKNTLGLPPLLIEIIDVEMENWETAAYQTVKWENSGTSVVELLVGITRLRQFLSFAPTSERCYKCTEPFNFNQSVLMTRKSHCVHSDCYRESLGPTLNLKHLSSSKINKTVELVEKNTGKSLVFVNFLQTIDVLKLRLKIPFWIISGESTQKCRENNIRKFNNCSCDCALLLTLKCGGEGLNLASANMVIMVDPWWNPQAEAQAFHRAHRLDSQHEVRVIRLMSVGTIEERVVELQKRKEKLFECFVDRRLTSEELVFLLE